MWKQINNNYLQHKDGHIIAKSNNVPKPYSLANGKHEYIGFFTTADEAKEKHKEVTK
jgi:hypothetical protein